MSSLSQSLEDYLEAIYIIGLKKKVVRVKDLMNYFNYKVSSVNNALKILSEKGLIIHEKYGYIELTDKGKKVADKLYDKHKCLTRFFNDILGIKESIAVEDACAIEHHLHKETFLKLQKLVTFMATTSNGKKCTEEFRKFLVKK